MMGWGRLPAGPAPRHSCPPESGHCPWVYMGKLRRGWVPHDASEPLEIPALELPTLS